MVRKLIVACALLGVMACGHPSPPNPIPPPVPGPTTHLESISVYGPHGPVDSAYGILAGDNGAVYEAAAESGYRMAFRVDNTSTGGATMTVWAGDLMPASVRVNFCPSTCEQPNIFLEDTHVELPRLVQRTKYAIGKANGEYFSAVEATDFNLLGRFVAGENIEPVLSQRNGLGFNTVRVFTAYNVGVGSPQPIGRLVPSEHPNFYSRTLPAFADALAKYHLYVELVGFTGPYAGVLEDDTAKIHHWDALCGVAQAKTNVQLELVNEYHNAPNVDIPFGRLNPCPGVLNSHGSEPSNDDPVQPVWAPGYGTIHPAPQASGEWQRTYGHIAMEASDHFGVPMVVNEGTRATDQDANCQHFADSSRAAALLSAGSNYHSIAGKNSRLWEGGELACAAAFAQAANSLPLSCQDGAYWNNVGGATGNVLREYHRGADPACVAIIHR